MEMDDPILREILRALDRDELPDTASLLADHPDRAETVNRLMRAALDYRRSTSWLSSVRDRPTLAPGCVLGDFEVIDILGRGGASVVYRARQLQLGGRVVALKTALESNLTGGSAERFRRECITLAEIHHPGLAEVYGFGIANGVLYYAMQLIEGPTLREVLGRLRELGRAGGDSDQIDPILRVACDVAQGLSVLHRGGLVHRDVKPSNIIVEADRADRGVIPAGRAVLIDFGLVHPIDPASGTVSCGAGTLVFAAPEQVLGGRVDARADVFALGVTLHDALTGREASARPQASSGLEPLRDVAPFVSKDLAAVVDKAVLIDPEGRYPNAEALLADLEALRRGGAVTARRISPVASAVRVMRSEPRRVLRGALVLLVVGLVLWGVVAVSRERDRALRLESAFEIADLREFGSAAREMTPFATWLVDRPAREALGRLPHPPLSLILDATERGDLVSANTISAGVIRTEGYRDDLIERVFLREVEVSRSAEGLRLLMRLCHEREDSGGSAWRFAGLLRQVITDAGTHAPGLHRALTGLSGVATSADVERCLSLVDRREHDEEARRLALFVVSRTLRRMQRDGTLRDRDLDRVEATLRDQPSLLPRCFLGQGACLSYPWASAVMSLARATALARRERGQAPIPIVFDGDVGDHLIAAEHSGLPAELLAASADARLDDVLLAGSWPVGQTPGDVEGLGYLLGMRNDEDMTHRVRERVERDAASFDRGVDRGLRAGAGLLPELDPDEGSKLRWPSAPLVWSDLDAGAKPAGFDAAFVARWDFQTPERTLWSAARGARVCLAALQTDEDEGHHLLLADPGRSAVQLFLSVPEGGLESPVSIELTGLAAVRSYMAYEGEAFLRLVVDGGEELGTLRFDQDSKAQPRTVRLPTSRLSQGTHRVTMHLEASSTTTLRLYEVSLKRMT